MKSNKFYCYVTQTQQLKIKYIYQHTILQDRTLSLLPGWALCLWSQKGKIKIKMLTGMDSLPQGKIHFQALGCWLNSVSCGCQDSGPHFLTGCQQQGCLKTLHLSNGKISLLSNPSHALRVSEIPSATSWKNLFPLKDLCVQANPDNLPIFRSMNQ